uniref:DUF4919 domain-containing protein n=1 Tax=Ningiella ruwaisensis TaxID=2364274 RepID=UPI00109EF81E|nr:DUF4919 domain-containing protein [Ningiella ruwaisensis]
MKYLLLLKRFLALILVSMLFTALLSGCASQPKNIVNYAKSDKDYLALKQTIINQVANTDTFDRILAVYPLTSFYQPNDDKQAAGKLLTETYIEEGQYQACINAANEMLAQNYTSLTGHHAASLCAQGLGDERLARFHTYVLDSLIEAIWRTGDGQSPQQALHINSSIDLYAFIQLHQLVAVGQDLVYLQQIPIQKMTVQAPENQRRFTWFFDVTPQFRRGLLDKAEGRN